MPPGYPKPDAELKFSVLESEAAWAGRDPGPPPNAGLKSPPPRGPPTCLEGVTCVFSGVMDSLEREEAEDFVKRHGGKVTSAVSGRTTFLVVGTSCGQSKVKKARELGTVLVDEDGLFALVEHLAKEQALAEGGEDEEKPEEGKGAARRTQRDEEMPDAAAEEAMKKPEPDGPAKKPNEPKPEPNKPDSSSHAAAAVASGSGAPGSSKRQHAEDSTPLWVNKYKPSAPAQLIGNGKNIADLRRFLQTWEAIHLTGEHPSAGLKGKDKPMKAVLISGPPGIGKSSAATIIARQLGFEVTEVNASDTRGKSSGDVRDGVGGKASNAIREMVTNRAVSFFGGKPKKMVLVMDEVDGMSGGDRGGVQELIACIKMSKIPIVCICNDKYNQKLKSLQNYTQDMPFSRPTKPQILNRMLKIAEEEGIQMSASAMEALIETTNNDIRSIINQLQMRRLTKQSFEYDDVKTLAKKDVDMGPFTAVDKLCAPNADRMSVNDRLNLVFQDADIIPLFIQENYPHYRPFAAKSELDRLELVAKAARNIAEGDVMNKSVRVKQNWGLMPYANIVSAVMPASALRGPREVFGAFPGERNFNRFPGWLGKNSTHGKNKRLLREIHAHATSASSGEDAGGFKADAAALREAYLPVLKTIITAPMRSHAMGGREKEGIEEVMATMDAYSLTRADWESVQDICKFRGRGPLFQDPSAGVPTAVKTAFTKRCNSTSRTVHSGILTQEAKKGKRRGGGGGGEDALDDDAEEGEEGEEEDDEGAAAEKKAPKLSAKKMAAMGFVPKEDPKAKKKKTAAKKK